jgi:Rrf2 family protein
MRFSNASAYALHALAHLAAAGEKRLVLSYDIARAWGISERYLPKVLRRLVSAQLVRSRKGPHGGYRLAKPAARITLLEVVEAVDGPVRVEASVAAGGRGPLDGLIQEICEEVAGLVRRRLGRVRLADLAGKR